MDLTQLRQFKVIAETENISEASALLYATQPALSRAIHKLEDELGVPLFDRKGKKIRINEAGLIVLEYANQILHAADEMKLRLESISNHSTLNVCSSVVCLMQNLIPVYCISHPELSMFPQIKPQEELKTLLLNDTFDVVLSAEKLEDESLCCIPLCRDWEGVSVRESHPLASKKAVSLEDVTGKVFATYNHLNPLTIMAKKLLDKINVSYVLQSDINSWRIFVESADYITLCSTFSSIYTRYLPAHRVIIPFEKEAGLTMVYYLVYRKNTRKGSDIQQLLDWLRKELEEYNRTFPLELTD